MRRISYFVVTMVIAVAALIAVSCDNPFAPGLADNAGFDAVIGDQRNIEGVFKNFRYAYTFKDTSVYGNLLDEEFIFVYRNYDRGVDVSWGREEDMRSTAGLFAAAQNLDLIWNEIAVQIGDSVLLDISRSFSLTITFSPEDVVRLDGRANFRLKRDDPEEVWKIVRWRDETNY